MKKMLMGILAMLLVLTMGTTVFAANSPGTDAALNRKAQEWADNVKSVTAKGANNTIYNINKSKVDASKVNSVNQAASSVDASGKVLAMADLTVAGDNIDTSKGVTLTLQIDPASIGSNYSVYILHQYGNGKWEVVKPSSVTSDGKVTVTLYSLSPVAVVQYLKSANVPTSDPSKNQSDGKNNTNNNTNSTESNTNSNNTSTSGPSQSNSNSSNSSNSNNQSNNQSNNNDQDNNNNQTNNQNNPVNVKQNVTVNYPDKDAKRGAGESNYADGYSDGYKAGRDSVKGTSVPAAASTSASNGKAASGGTTSAGVLSPKTGASLPALPIVAVFALAGIAVCGKKAHANR